jgi:hypothetical protein
MIETISIVNKEVSKRLGIQEDIIKSVNAFYWKNVKGSINTAQNTSIRINNLGTYVISRTKLWILIKRRIKEIRYFRTTTKEFKVKDRDTSINDLITELRILLQRRNDIAIIYRNNELKAKAKRDAKRDLEQ